MGSRRRVKKPKYVIVDYDRRGNPRVYFRKPGEKKIRLRGPLFEKDFWEDYQAAVEGRLKPREKPEYRGQMPAAGTFDRLCVDYYGSADFRQLNSDTRYRRRLTLDPLREKVGALPVRKIEAKHVREMRDKRAEKPHAANNLVKTLRVLFKFGVEFGYMKINPARDVQLLKTSVDGYHTWSPKELARFEAKYPVGTQQRLAFDLMLYTGVRRGDAFRLGRQHLQDGRLVFTPSKTNGRKAKRLSIPVHPNLAASIEATPTGDLTFLTKKNGEPWGGRESFGNRFKQWCTDAGLQHCSAHGLRKAATVMLLEAGCSAAQASAITGHDSLQVLEHYARERDRAKLADDAMALWTGAEKSDESVPLEIEVSKTGTYDAPKLLIAQENAGWMAPRTGLEPVTR